MTELAPVYVRAHAYVAALLAATFGFPVPLDPESPPEPQALESGAAAAIAVETGPTPTLLAECLGGGAGSFEFEQSGRLEILVAGGDRDVRDAALTALLRRAQAAIEMDPTLGGQVAFAELRDASFDIKMEAESVSGGMWAADIVLTYAANDALG